MQEGEDGEDEAFNQRVSDVNGVLAMGKKKTAMLSWQERTSPTRYTTARVVPLGRILVMSCS